MVTVTPYIPAQITVHLGPPTASAANVTVSFADYVKNVASSEIYPTWEDSALVANILAIISFALNRVYTEFYRSRGYDFDITSSTAIDQKFINGRNIFENVGRLVDELFNTYLRRQGWKAALRAPLRTSWFLPSSKLLSEIAHIVVEMPPASACPPTHNTG